MLRLLPIMLDYASCELYIINSINYVYSFELVPLTIYTTVYGFNYNSAPSDGAIVVTQLKVISSFYHHHKHDLSCLQQLLL